MKGGKLGTGRSCNVANAFPDGWGRIPDSPLVAASISALFKGGSSARSLVGGWSPDDGGRPIYRHAFDGDFEIVVSVDPHSAPDGTGAARGQWALVEGITSLTIDVLLAVLAQASTSPFDAHSDAARPKPVPLTARSILRDKAVVQWGAAGAALRRRVDSEISRLHGLRFDIRRAHDGASAFWQWNGGGAGDRCQLFDIVKSETGRSVRKAGAGVPESVWLIRPGWWSGAGRAPREQIRFAPVPQMILQFDHRRNRGSAVLAKKIGLGMFVLWRDSRPGGTLPRRVGDLIEEIGELPRRDARGEGWGGRMRDRLVQAVALLQETGVLGGAEWPAGREPERGESNKRKTGAWLAGKIVLHRSAAAGVSGGAIDTRTGSMRRPEKNSRGLLELHRGSVIRAMRMDRKISQDRLARELGISAAYLSQIENERRMASQAVLGRIAGWASRDGDGGSSGSDKPDAPAPLEFPQGGRRKVGGSRRHAVAGTFLQATAPCGPAGKDNLT